ncbi:MAG: helix-turn-helix domain-containing protein [Elusimicrobiota bacterium]
MARPDTPPELFSQATDPKGLVHINGRCLLQTRDERRVVSVLGVVLAQYCVGDRMSEAHAMVNLVDQGHADQNDVARAFGCSTRTVRRVQERFA